MWELASQVRLVICLAVDRRVVYATAMKAIRRRNRNTRSVCITQDTSNESTTADNSGLWKLVVSLNWSLGGNPLCVFSSEMTRPVHEPALFKRFDHELREIYHAHAVAQILHKF